MGRNRGRTYGVREFARLAGVSVKALHHYDRLGLLTPPRTEAGYRQYGPPDLARLDEIVALRVLGIPLREIKTILNGNAAPLASILRRQREVLEARRRELDGAIGALTLAEESLALDPEATSKILQRVMGAIGMPDVEAMRKYFSEEAWPEWHQHFENWPPAEWRDLLRDVARSLEMDPASEVAQTLADRWVGLGQGPLASRSLRDGLRRAWLDRENWPPSLKRRLVQFDVERAARFVSEALWSRWDAEREARERAGTAPPRVSLAKQTLFREWTHILGRDPASHEVQALLGRWRSQIEEETAGDDEMKARIKRGFEQRRLWPLGMKKYHASLFDTDLDTWERVTDLIEQALRVAS